MNRPTPLLGLVVLLALSLLRLSAANPPAPSTPAPARSTSTYVLSPNDIIELKVYREEDMETKVRVAKDGTASFPLIGAVRVQGFTVEQAGELIRRLLDQDYLVNPQVTLSVVEYAKRRFTVLGQVGKPGTYEMPGDETRTTLLQAIAVAGGFTRLAKTSNVTISRVANGEKIRLVVDAREANDPNTKTFEVLPDDTITVSERIF
jgi:polysaccharide export outer membrane protein